MLGKFVNAFGNFSKEVFKGAVNSASRGFGVAAAIGLVYGTYAWGYEIGHKKALKEQEKDKDDSCYGSGRYPWGQPKSPEDANWEGDEDE